MAPRDFSVGLAVIRICTQFHTCRWKQSQGALVSSHFASPLAENPEIHTFYKTCLQPQKTLMFVDVFHLYLLVCWSAGLHVNCWTDFCNRTWMEDGSRPRTDPMTFGWKRVRSRIVFSSRHCRLFLRESFLDPNERYAGGQNLQTKWENGCW